MRLRSRGFTLAELLVTIVLLVAFLGFTAKFVMDALDSQDMDRRTRKAQVATRTALEQIINDMRTAAVFPASGSIGSTALPCGILYPGSRDDTIDTSKQNKVSMNKLVLLHNDATDLNNINPSDFSAVFYCVVRNNRILRFSKKLNDWSDVAYPPGSPYNSKDYWKIRALGDLVHCAVSSSDSVSTIQSNYASDDDYLKYGVARLEGPNDYLHFWVGHSRFNNPSNHAALTGSYGERRYGTFFDRKLFNVRVVATVFYKGTSGGSIDSTTAFNENAGVWPPVNPQFTNSKARYSQVESTGSVRIQSSLD